MLPNKYARVVLTLAKKEGYYMKKVFGRYLSTRAFLNGSAEIRRIFQARNLKHFMRGKVFKFKLKHCLGDIWEFRFVNKITNPRTTSYGAVHWDELTHVLDKMCESIQVYDTSYSVKWYSTSIFPGRRQIKFIYVFNG